MLEAKTLGKPYAGKPHVRIEEGVRQGNSSLTTLLYRLFLYKSAGKREAKNHESLRSLSFL
jgi:hypothetical protein